MPHKNKLLSLFHINACSLNKNFDDLQHLLNCTNFFWYSETKISETKITKQVSLSNNLNLNYCFEFTPTETSTGGTLLYIANHLSNKCNNDLNIYKKNELESTFIEGNQGNQIFYTQSFADIDLLTLLTLVKII